MIVADTNLIAYFFIPGDYTVDARSLFLKDPDWVAPLLWKSEFRNVVATYLRHGYFNLKDALTMVNEAERLLHGNEYAVPAIVFSRWPVSRNVRPMTASSQRWHWIWGSSW